MLRAILGFLAGFIVAIGFGGHAQTYLGLSSGITSQGVNNQRDCHGCDLTDKRLSLGNRLVIGYRSGRFAAEVGYGELGRNRREASHGGNPNHQNIETEHAFARGLYFIPVTGEVEVFAALGVSRVSFTNREWCNCAWNGGRFTEHENSGRDYRPNYGLGVSWKFAKGFRAVADYMQVNKVAVSPWTLSSTAKGLWIGLQADL